MKFTKSPYVWLPLWIAIGIAVGIFIGNTFSIFKSRHSLFNRGDKLEAVLEYINDSYVDSINLQELVEDAIPNLITGLDPHSTYISAKDLDMVNEDLEGHFSGIGVQFSILNDTIVVISVIPGGPSSAAGIVAGDRIVKVEGKDFVGKTLTNELVMRNLRGAKGSSVKLGIKHFDSAKIVSITVKRGDIPVNTVDVSFSIAKGVGYVKVDKFGSTTYSEFINALSKLKAEGVKSIIIDLRQNTGGYMQAAEMMVNEFLPKNQLVVFAEGRNFPRDAYYSDGSGTFQNEQVIVLVDEGSASASEIFAGAIQDTDRGLIIGRRTFGKGLVQQQREFKDGSALRLTVARYHTPSGRCIQKAYTRGKSEDYQMDLMNRYLRGELDNQDSIKFNKSMPLFKTKGGRPIRGNDGIMPDIFVPRDTIGINSYYLNVVNKGYTYEYAIRYIDRNRAKLKSFKNLQQLVGFLENQSLVENLVEYAFLKGVNRRPYLIDESYDLLQKQLISNVIRPLMGESAYFQYVLKDDVLLKRTIGLVHSQKATQEAIVSQRYKK
jgi:carboxyl-terminal processing protease